MCVVMRLATGGYILTVLQTLNAVTVNQDWTVLTTALFAEDMDDMFEAAVFALLGWATCAGQYGLHRVYITARVLAHTGRDLQNVLFSWLDNSSFETSEADAVAILMGHFIRDGLFEYTSYLHRLLVRDERGLSFGSVSTLHVINPPELMQ
jgi:mediator of RNA polymerase II transcription subunit 12